MWKLKQLVPGGDEEREENFLEEESDGLCSLSYTQRMYAFAACLVVGLACMFLSMIVFIKPIKFAILFTLGNLLAVGSTAFLIGPAQQINMMFDSARIYATAVYLGCVVIALICALLVFGKELNLLQDLPSSYASNSTVFGFLSKYAERIHSKILTLIAIICEICALIWYSLSYIPFARRIVSDLMVRFCDTEL
ncbi:hypothetical protein EZV62_006158 [Acer yangbiense]|uniref:Vesicle transport protein n=1 Tax=Acer yangbiense TaxID=1000413 RepID=A0A5C7IPD4_9ROSI|nr:hypothetical protein EZV62_006158 [Acer yangbiense]